MDCFVPQDDGSRTTWVSIIAIYTGHTKTKMPTVQMLPLFALTAAIPHLTVHLTDKKHFSDLDLTNKVVPLVWHDFWQDRAGIKIMELTVGPSEVFLHASLMVRKAFCKKWKDSQHDILIMTFLKAEVKKWSALIGLHNHRRQVRVKYMVTYEAQ
jgi:hypothetical protein